MEREREREFTYYLYIPGTSIPRRRTVMSGPRPTEGTTYRNAVTSQLLFSNSVALLLL